MRGVDITKAEVSEWANYWPCFGKRQAIWFEFAANGDLIDKSDTNETDDGAVLALSFDAAEGKIGTAR